MQDIENILGKQAPKSKVAKWIRRFAYKSTLIRYQMMDYWQGNWAQEIAAGNLQEVASRNESLITNEKLQQEMSQIFLLYHHLCQRCQYCCHSDLFIYRIDCILYGWKLNNPLMVPQINLTVIIKLITPGQLNKLINQLFRRKADIKKLTHSEANTLVPCSFLTDIGCKFAYGRRPTICVLYLCEYFMSEMSWRDFTRYIRLAHQYCRHLSRSARLIVSEYRRQHSR